MQIAYGGKVQCWNDSVEVTGTTESGRQISIYLNTPQLDFLRLVFSFMDAHNVNIGHAGWHIENNMLIACTSCKYSKPD